MAHALAVRFSPRLRESATCATEAASAASSRVANPRKLTAVPSSRPISCSP